MDRFALSTAVFQVWLESHALSVALQRISAAYALEMAEGSASAWFPCAYGQMSWFLGHAVKSPEYPCRL